MVRAGVSPATVTVQPGLLPPGGQVLPTVLEVMAVTITLSPVSGLFTVTENVIVAVAPTARFPVQVRFGLA